MVLHVVDLTQIENATEEDRLQGIDYWAKLFKATTWEEIKMLASNNSFLTEAAETVYQLSAEDRIRLQCEAREDFYNQQRYLQQWRERLEKDCASLEEEKETLTQEKETLTQEKETLAKKNETLVQENEQLLQDIAAQKEMIAQLQARLAEK